MDQIDNVRQRLRVISSEGVSIRAESGRRGLQGLLNVFHWYVRPRWVCFPSIPEFCDVKTLQAHFNRPVLQVFKHSKLEPEDVYQLRNRGWDHAGMALFGEELVLLKAVQTGFPASKLKVQKDKWVRVEGVHSRVWRVGVRNVSDWEDVLAQFQQLNKETKKELLDGRTQQALRFVELELFLRYLDGLAYAPGKGMDSGHQNYFQKLAKVRYELSGSVPGLLEQTFWFYCKSPVWKVLAVPPWELRNAAFEWVKSEMREQFKAEVESARSR